MEDFDAYVENFKKLDLSDKERIVLEQLKMLAMFANTMCGEIKAKNEILINKELIDVTKDGYSRDDFVEAVMVYTNSIQNSLSDFNLKLVDIVDKVG